MFFAGAASYVAELWKSIGGGKRLSPQLFHALGHFFLTSSLKKPQYYNLLINNIL